MLRITLSLAFVALGVAFSNTPHTGCNDAAPEVVQAVTVEQGYVRPAPVQVVRGHRSSGRLRYAGIERVQGDLLRVVRAADLRSAQ